MAANFGLLDGVKKGDTITVRFKANQAKNLHRLTVLESKGVITLKRGQRLTLEAVRLSGSWDRSQVQTFTVGSSWDRVTFRNAMSSMIDSLSVARP